MADLENKKHIVRAEKFNINELDKKITTLTKNLDDEKPSPSVARASPVQIDG